MADSTGVALIGTGGVATLHAEAIAAVPSLHIAGSFSRNPENVRRFTDRHGGRPYATRDDMLSDPQVDVVAICTPADQHVEPAIEALRAGKHVIVEKPVGNTVDEIDTLRHEAERAGRICMPCHNYIYGPALRRAKDLVETGRLGRIANFWLIYNQKHDADAGEPGLAMRQLCIHHAYVALFLLGRPTSVIAAASNVHFTDPEAHDQVMMTYTMPNGAIANLWGSFATDDRSSSPWTVYYKLLGTDGGVAYSWNDAYCGDAPQPGWDIPAYRDSFRYVYEHFATHCLAAGEAPLSTLDDARDALRLIETAEQALSGGTPVDYP